MIREKIFKKDKSGNTRVWWMEVEGNAYRAHSGILDGKIVTSGWQYAEAKNEGKTNATTPEEQALLEVDSKYTHQLFQGGYHSNVKNINKSKYFKPMLAKNYKDLKKPVVFPVYSQPKLDGIRCIATKDGIFTRNGKELVSTPHINEELKYFFQRFPSDILDGELYNHKLKNDFDRIISLARKSKPKPEDIEEAKDIEYHIYDAYSNKSFEKRFFRTTMRMVAMLDRSPHIKYVDTQLVENQEDLDQLCAQYMADEYEGQMIRFPGIPYENSRSKSLLKRKEYLGQGFEDDEFEILDIVEGKGDWAGAAKIVYFRNKDGSEDNKASLRGTYEKNKELLENKQKYIGGEVTVKYQGINPDSGKLRFPVAHAFYEGKRDL